MPTDRVLIVGGGLAGPSLALALARQNIRSSIFELRPTRTVAEGSISLAPNAPRALDHVVGVYDRLKAAAFSYRRFAMHADDGYLFGHLPDLVQVRYGVRITYIEDRDDGVTLHFEDGTTARGDILIGADGIHSKVREHVLGASALTPTFLGSCMLTGTLPLASINAPPDWTFPAVLFTPVGLVSVWPHNPSGTEAAWCVAEDLPPKDRAAWREYEASGDAARAAKRNYAGVQTPVIRALMDTLWTPHCIPELPRWHRGRVCVIGDAAHALPPNGQGSAMAFEDAAYLARLLGAHPLDARRDVARVFAQFERNRRPRIERVRALAHGTGGAKGGTAAGWKYTLKKWGMAAYFAWNGYELRDERISGYDVTKQDVGVGVE
ncbi:putative kynurenine 3-monooxygenase [Mycena albidolilacea]|uniref:Kynurenine 3-monooxygenase n=1 Tax=Mycena albidolilacea TaxID=1033008 RepID=A0AAD6Z0J3_9AGAR|nr:putative kynurenine 3-monooxygenase [Mycena albidolilacea]